MKKNRPKGLRTPNWYCKFIGWIDGRRGNYIKNNNQRCISSFSEKKLGQFQRYTSVELKHLELRTASKRSEALQILSRLRVNPMLDKQLADAATDQDRRDFLECQAFLRQLHSIQAAISTSQIQVQQMLYGVAARYRSKLISYFVGMHRGISTISENVPEEMYLEQHPSWRAYAANNSHVDQLISQFLAAHETL